MKPRINLYSSHGSGKPPAKSKRPSEARKSRDVSRSKSHFCKVEKAKADHRFPDIIYCEFRVARHTKQQRESTLEEENIPVVKC